MGKPATGFVVIALLLVGLLGVGAAQEYVVGVSFDGGGWFDRSFNEGTWRGVTRAVGEAGSEHDIDILVYNGPADTTLSALNSIAESGLDLMVSAGFLQQAAVAQAAEQHPEVGFVLIDAVVDAPNVRSVLFREHEGSYLVGYIAGSLSQTGVVGFVGGMDIPLIRAFDLGYQQGVVAACPECTVLSDYVGETPEAWSNPQRARELAQAQQAQGADIIYAAAGDSGNGVIAFVTDTQCFSPGQLELRRTPLTAVVAELPKSAGYAAKCGAGSQPLFFIGVDSNQNDLGDTDGDPATLNHGLTSMLKRVDVAAYNAVMDMLSGTFEGGMQNLGLAEDGVGYALDEYNRALIPESLVAQLETIEQEIISGRRTVRDYREEVGQ